MGERLLIRLDDPTLASDLLRTLHDGDCTVAVRGDGAVEVVHRRARDAAEARIELEFFLGAWRTRHPEAWVELLGGTTGS